MNRHKFILTLALTLIFKVAFAHQDFYVTKDYGNVKVRIKTGFDYEEINKVFIYGQLAEKLAKELKYPNQIFLDFTHYYTGDCEPDYFISFDGGKIESSWSSDEDKDLLKGKAIVIRQVARQFGAQTTLKLLEYAILNIADIQSTQKQIEYNENYCKWRINSIDTAIIKNSLVKPNSVQLSRTLKTKIERPDKDFKHGISYYWKDNKYTLFIREPHKSDTEIKSFDDIYNMKKFDGSSAVVFDTDSSFYYVSQYDERRVSNRHIIESVNDYYRPYKVQSIGGDKLSIYFWYYSKDLGIQPKERTLIYLIKKDELIPDLDKLIEK